MKDHRQRLQWPTTGKVQFHVKKNEIWRMGRFLHFVVLSNVIWWKCVPKKNGQGVSACTRADRAPMKEAVAFCRRIARSSRALPKKTGVTIRDVQLFFLSSVLSYSSVYQTSTRYYDVNYKQRRRPHAGQERWQLNSGNWTGNKLRGGDQLTSTHLREARPG